MPLLGEVLLENRLGDGVEVTPANKHLRAKRYRVRPVDEVFLVGGGRPGDLHDRKTPDAVWSTVLWFASRREAPGSWKWRIIATWKRQPWRSDSKQ